MLMISTPQKIVGQHLVVAGAVAIEIVRIGLHVSRCKRLVVTIECVEAVKALAHSGVLASANAAAQHR